MLTIFEANTKRRVKTNLGSSFSSYLFPQLSIMVKNLCSLLVPQDSDEEDEDAENTEAVSSGKVTRSPSPAPQEEHSEPEMTEEEKEYQMVSVVFLNAQAFLSNCFKLLSGY